MIRDSLLYRQASEILHQVYGPEAAFRPGQYEAIEAVATRHRTLVVQRTGWGKSLVYFICTTLFRRQGRGITMVVSPLLVIMDNQAEMARSLGISCDVLNSSVKERRENILDALIHDQLDLIFVTPETLFKEDIQAILPQIRIGLFVVDEAHCISDWGHDFRLEYGRLGQVVRRMPFTVAVLGTTATANDRVVKDLQNQLGENVFVLRGPLSRDSLHLQVLHLNDRVSRYAWLLENLPKLPGTGIIYCLTRRDCDYLSDFLNQNGISVRPYYSGDGIEEENSASIVAFRENRIKALVATVKLGMGYDKGDISFIVHYQMPSNIVLYYQQIGRAGRSIPDAYVFLMCGQEDLDINNYFIDTAFPSEKECSSVLAVVGESDGVGRLQIEAAVNIRRGRLEKTLAFLLNEGVLRKDDRKYFITPKRFQYDSPRYDAITAIRRREMEQMLELTHTNRCLSRFAVEALDDYSGGDCGKCRNCLGHDIFPGLSVSFETEQTAADYINGLLIPIEPRKRWPDGKKIPNPNQTGFCLSKYGDPGFGALVKQGKYSREMRFSDELVGKSARLLRDLAGEAGVTTVTCVPSLRSDLVLDFARRVAVSAGLHFIELIRKSPARQQKEMENTAFQCRNAMNSFSVEAEQVPEKLVLIDDIVDSRWTMTVCGHLLSERGCQAVYPFALADSSSREV